MTLRPALAAMAAVAATAVLAGCSGGESGGAGTPTGQVSASSVVSTPPVTSAPESPTVTEHSIPADEVSDEVLAWTDRFCGALGGLGGLSDIAPPDLRQGDVAGAKHAVSDYLGRLDTALGSSLDGLRDLGQAPVPEGEQARQALVGAFGPARQQVTEAKRKLDAARNDDQQALAEATKSLQSIGTAMGELENPMRGIESSPELAAAARQAPECQKLGN
ncbi:hypothetical protein [Qaidamihabitans albus]|uniref:hypothetical protein n=1 Tax=Qaidamihabitans albus TaxID=2795733 RepID=UPI0018F13D13|nr:hypothetical protein [Qaidamihabitans albus]